MAEVPKAYEGLKAACDKFFAENDFPKSERYFHQELQQIFEAGGAEQTERVLFLTAGLGAAIGLEKYNQGENFDRQVYEQQLMTIENMSVEVARQNGLDIAALNDDDATALADYAQKDLALRTTEQLALDITDRGESGQLPKDHPAIVSARQHLENVQTLQSNPPGADYNKKALTALQKFREGLTSDESQSALNGFNDEQWTVGIMEVQLGKICERQNPDMDLGSTRQIMDAISQPIGAGAGSVGLSGGKSAPQEQPEKPSGSGPVYLNPGM